MDLLYFQKFLATLSARIFNTVMFSSPTLQYNCMWRLKVSLPLSLNVPEVSEPFEEVTFSKVHSNEYETHKISLSS